ncbi:MAG: metallophosphoesterase family protein [Archaeoglobaceae archaeon]
MKLLIASDIHSEVEKLKAIIKKESFDLLLISGDLTDFKISDALLIDRILSSEGLECYAVHGNCDYEEILELELESIEFVHGRSIKIGDFTLHGIGGSLQTPFNTPSEYPENYFAEIFKKFNYSTLNILLSHSPAKGILDKTKHGLNVGSEEIAKKIENFDIAITGHVHESFGVYRGKVFVINPGPVAWGRFATLNLNEMIVELKKI